MARCGQLVLNFEHSNADTVWTSKIFGAGFWISDLQARLKILLGLVIFMLVIGGVSGQVVSVTMSLDTNRVAVGSATTLRVYAQILPAIQPSTDRIFSWYIDLLDLDGTVARGEYAQLRKPAADNDPSTSSSGKTDGGHRRGIYDTFMNLPNAGRTNRIELFHVPVTGVSTGRVAFRVQAGTTVTNLNHDFIVAPAGGGDPLTGGEYSLANTDLEVSVAGVSVESPRFSITRSERNQFRLSFPTTAGRNYTVEARDSLRAGTQWLALSGGPHNSGMLTVTNDAPERFYRVRLGP